MTENEFVFASYVTSKKAPISQEQIRADLKYHFGNGKYVNECASLLESKGLIDRDTWLATDDLHLVYQTELRKRLDKEISEKLQAVKLQYEVRYVKRVYKTYWLTFGMALAGFLISLTLLILKLKESK